MSKKMDGKKGGAMSGVNCSASSNIIVDSVLCYASTARHSMKTDDIVRVSIGYFKENDILKSKDFMCDLLAIKSVRRRNENRLSNEMKDIMEMLSKCDDENIITPVFVCDSYNGMPPSSGFECVASKLLNLMEELSSLREEVGYLRENRHHENTYREDVTIIKEDIFSIKGEIRKINRHLLKENNKKNSIQLDCPKVVSRNSFLISEPCQDIIEAEKIIDDYDEALLTATPSAPPLSQESSLNSIPSAPSASQINEHYFLDDIQDFGGPPSAPSYAEMVNQSEECMNGITSPRQKRMKGHHSPSQISNKRTRSIPNSSADGKQPPFSNPVPGTSGSSTRTHAVDDEGFQLVEKRRRKQPNIVGSRKTESNGIIKGAVRFSDIYLGNLEKNVTSDDICEYILNEFNIKVENCETLTARNVNSKSFKITVKLSDRPNLLIPEAWPEEVICRKFFNSRKQK